MKSRFELGPLRTSTQARKALGRIAYDLICRHALCDFGIATEQEQQYNMHAIGGGTGRVISRYRSDPTANESPPIVVVTETGGLHTTVYLESELHL